MTTTLTRAKNLKAGDQILSSTGNLMKVTNVTNTSNKTIVLFDGDLEIDFHPYTELKIANKDEMDKKANL